MTIWNENYKEKFEKASTGPRKTSGSIRKEVEKEMENFVGTRKQYQDEVDIRVLEAIEWYRTQDQISQSAIKNVIDEYKGDLRVESGLSEVLFNIVYQVAWDDSHSSGYESVEDRFFELADYFLKAYQLGYEAGFSSCIRQSGK